MHEEIRAEGKLRHKIVYALGEEPVFSAGDRIRISNRSPIGHYRVPTYLRGKNGVIERVIEPTGIDNEQEGYGRNAGQKLHYYRIAVPMTEIWPDYVGSPRDGLRTIRHANTFCTWRKLPGHTSLSAVSSG